MLRTYCRHFITLCMVSVWSLIYPLHPAFHAFHPFHPFPPFHPFHPPNPTCIILGQLFWSPWHFSFADERYLWTSRELRRLINFICRSSPRFKISGVPIEGWCITVTGSGLQGMPGMPMDWMCFLSSKITLRVFGAPGSPGKSCTWSL